MARRPKTKNLKFAAKLLFQFRVVANGKSNKMRTCEERLVVIHADTAESALSKAKARGRAAQHGYKNHDGNKVHFEFVGVMDLLHLGSECEKDEVWYDITVRKEPKERAKSILPPISKLNAIYWSRLG